MLILRQNADRIVARTLDGVVVVVVVVSMMGGKGDLTLGLMRGHSPTTWHVDVSLPPVGPPRRLAPRTALFLLCCPLGLVGWNVGIPG